MRLLAQIAFFLVLAFPSFGQTVGGAGWCKTSVNPNTITSLRVVNQRNMCSNVWDTLARKMYYYDYALTVGSRWVEFVPLGPPIGAETKVEAGTGISVAGNGTIATPYVVTNTGDLSNTNEIQRLDTFAVVSGILRASLLNDGVPFSGVPLPVPDGSETKVNAGTAIGVSGTGTTGSPYVVTNTAPDQTVSITNGGGIGVSGTYPAFTLTATDPSTTNELQNLSLTGQSLGISSGTGVTLPIVGVTAGTGISVSTSSGNATVTNTGDLSSTNEIQRLDTFAVVSGVLRASLLNDGVPFSSVTLPTADGSETKVNAGTAIGITGIGTTGSPYVVTNTADLSVTAGGTNALQIALNTSGQTPIFVKGMGQVTVTESATGDTIRIGGVGGIYGVSDTTTGNHIATIAADRTLTFRAQDDDAGGIVPFRVTSTGNEPDIMGLYADGDSLVFGKSDTEMRQVSSTGLSIMAANTLALIGDSVVVQNLPTAPSTEKTYVVQGTDAYLRTREGIPLDHLTQSGATTGQVVKWNGTAWVADTDSGGDNWGSQTVTTTGGTLSGVGTAGSPLKVATGGIGATELSSLGTAGTYGSATQVPVFTTDADGRVPAVTNTTITGLLPSGTSNQTLRHNGTNWEASSFVANTGAALTVNNITLDGNNIFLPITGVVQAARFRANATGSHTLLESQRGGVRDWQIDNVNGDIWVYGDGLGAYHTYISSLTGYMGLGTSSATQKLHVSGNARITGAIYDSNNDPGTSVQVLSSTVTGTDWVTVDTNPSDDITGSGTTNYVPKFTSAQVLGNSLLFDDGTNVGIGTASPTSHLFLKYNGTGLTETQRGFNIQDIHSTGTPTWRFLPGYPGSYDGWFQIRRDNLLCQAIDDAGRVSYFSDLQLNETFQLRPIQHGNSFLRFNNNAGVRNLQIQGWSDVLISTQSGYETWFVGATGFWGFGTASPSEKLHIVGNTRTDGTLTTRGTGTQPVLHLHNTTGGTGRDWTASSYDGGSFAIGHSGIGNAIEIDGATEAVTIDGPVTLSTASGTGTDILARTAAGVVTVATLGSGLSLSGGTLSASGTLSGLTATRVPFASSATALTDDADFTYLPATNRLSIGNTGGSPAANLSIEGGTAASLEDIRASADISGNMITTLRNTNNTSGANRMVDNIVGGASAGDPMYRLLISGVDTWCFGVDNSDSDKLKIGRMTTPSSGSNVGITMTADATPLIGINNDAPSHPLHVIGRATATVLQGISGTPTHTFGAGAGTGPSLGTLTGCTNGFNLQITIGTTPTVGGNIVSVTFPTAFSNLSFPTYSCGNDQTALENAAGKFVISAASATALTIKHNALTPALNAGDVLFFRFNTSGR